MTHETENRTRGAGESRQLAGAEQRRVRRLREGGKERRQLYQAAAARHRIDEARAERCDEHEADFQGHAVRCRLLVWLAAAPDQRGLPSQSLHARLLAQRHARTRVVPVFDQAI